MSRYDEVLRYLTELRSALRLDSWDIILQEQWEGEEHEDTVLASTDWVDGHSTITLWINWDEWEKSDPARKKNTLVHELVHSQHRDLNSVWDTAVLDNPGISTRESVVFDKLYHEHTERFVAWVADRLCEEIEILEWPPTIREVGRGVYLNEGP